MADRHGTVTTGCEKKGGSEALPPWIATGRGSEAERRLGVVVATVDAERRPDRLNLGCGRIAVFEEASQHLAVSQRRVAVEQVDRADINLQVLVHLVADVEVRGRDRADGRFEIFGVPVREDGIATVRGPLG